MSERAAWIELGPWNLPAPSPGEEAKFGWCIDGCPYILFALVVRHGQVYRLHMFGYDPYGKRDEWAAESNTPFADLQAIMTAEMQRLAEFWGGRLRCVEVADAAAYADAVQTALAGGIVQLVPFVEEDDAAGQIPA